jgi:hypothetical protein
MKTKQLIRLIPLMLSMSPAFGQTAAERLEQWVQLQSAEGKLNEAIKEYEAVLLAAAKSQHLAAEARFRLVECHSRLGNAGQMNEHLEALRADFPADNKWVQRAAELVPPKWAFVNRPWKDGQLQVYQVTLPDGTVMGQFMIAQRLKKKTPDKVWESIAIRNASGESLSRTEFRDEDLTPLRSSWYLSLFGSVSLDFQQGGQVIFTDNLTGKEKAVWDRHKSGRPEVPVFENEQVIQILRVLDLEVGTKQKTNILSAHQGATAVAFDLEVTEHTEIEVPVGKFRCAKVSSNIGQDFFVSLDENRQLVRLDTGPVKIVLSETTEWKADETREVKTSSLGARISLPGVVLNSSEATNDEVFRMQIWSTDFAGYDGLIEVNKKGNLLPDAQKGSQEFFKVLKKGFAKNYDKFEETSEIEEIDLDGIKAVAVAVRGTRGEVTRHEYQVHAVGEELALSFRLHYAKPDEKRAIARAMEIVQSFRWRD